MCRSGPCTSQAWEQTCHTLYSDLWGRTSSSAFYSAKQGLKTEINTSVLNFTIFRYPQTSVRSEATTFPCFKRTSVISTPSSITWGSLAPARLAMVGRMSRVLASSWVTPKEMQREEDSDINRSRPFTADWAAVVTGQPGQEGLPDLAWWSLASRRWLALSCPHHTWCPSHISEGQRYPLGTFALVQVYAQRQETTPHWKKRQSIHYHKKAINHNVKEDKDMMIDLWAEDKLTTVPELQESHNKVQNQSVNVLLYSIYKSNPLSEVKKTRVLLITPVFSRVVSRFPIVLSNSSRASPYGPLKDFPAAPGPAYWG